MKHLERIKTFKKYMYFLCFCKLTNEKYTVSMSIKERDRDKRRET